MSVRLERIMEEAAAANLGPSLLSSKCSAHTVPLSFAKLLVKWAAALALQKHTPGRCVSVCSVDGQ